jgi:hypothetical protein
MQATWKAHEKHGDLTERSDLPDSVFASPKQRKEPMTGASHVAQRDRALRPNRRRVRRRPQACLRRHQNGSRALRRRAFRGQLEGAWATPEHRPHRRRSQEIGLEGGRTSLGSFSYLGGLVMNELGGWLWAVLGVVGVSEVGFALAYWVNEWRHRRKDFATRAERDRLTREVYREEDERESLRRNEQRETQRKSTERAAQPRLRGRGRAARQGQDGAHGRSPAPRA